MNDASLELLVKLEPSANCRRTSNSIGRAGNPASSGFANIPKELRFRSQWVGWLSVPGGGRRVKLPNGSRTKPLKRQKKPHKLPISPHTGGLASTNDPKTWATFQEALDAVARWSLSGIGFMFSDGDPYTGVDLDDCRDPEAGKIAEWARPILNELSSYTEISPSGMGVKITLRGVIPKGARNRKKFGSGQIEIYSRDRYFTFTGLHFQGAPRQIENRQGELSRLHSEIFRTAKTTRTRPPSPMSHSLLADEELIKRAKTARNGAKFQRLWAGEWEGEYPSQSEADLALCCMLAYWTDNDASKVDSLFRQSGLMRDKWDREDYRHHTIQAAITKAPGGRRSGSTYQNHERAVTVVTSAGAIPDLLHFPHTDTGNAERLVQMYGSDIRFCVETKRWLVWDGQRWNSENSRQVKKLFKKTVREMYKQAADLAVGDQRDAAEKHARKSESAQMINAALASAEYEDGMLLSASALDRHPYLLNCKNGTLDLRSGQLRQHTRQDLITKLVHFNYRPDAKCPKFLRFLYRIMGDNPDAEPTERAGRLVTYLQKCFGYALTGDVSEKAVFCFFGSGNNGKTTLLEVIRFVLAEYSAQVLIDSLMAHHSRESSAALADLADLRGARFVTTSEAEEGQRLAIGKVKYLTQGMGAIKTCRKYENPVIFSATHKFFIDANHKPVVRGAEKAIWNRLKPVPFIVTIPPQDIDKTLLEKLKAEAEGILAWMVIGCQVQLRDGIGDPPEVVDASATWQAESDHFPAFLQEQCLLQPRSWVPVAKLWPTYLNWCESNRENSLMKTAFDARLEEHGCKRGVREGARVRAWIGIRLRTSDDPLGRGDKVTRSDAKSC